MNFGERLKELRVEKGLTQEDVANALCVTKQAVSKWENGASFPDVAYLGALADFMGVNIDYLLTGNDNVKIEKQIEIVEKEKIVEVEKEVIKEKPVEVKKHYSKEEACRIAYKYLIYKMNYDVCVIMVIMWALVAFVFLMIGLGKTLTYCYVAIGLFGLDVIYVIVTILVYKRYKKEEQILLKKYGYYFVKQVSQYKNIYF